jgi:hypothetical protein
MVLITQVVPGLGSVPLTSDPVNFDARADTLYGTALPATVAAINVWAAQANALAGDLQQEGNAAVAARLAADAAAAAAVGAAAAAAASAGAVVWVSGSSYAPGTLVVVPGSGQAYRDTVGGLSVTNPDTDRTRWVSAMLPSVAAVGLPELWPVWGFFAGLRRRAPPHMLFTRGSAASRIDEFGRRGFAGQNVPRFDFAEGGRLRGLVFEAEATNLCVRSQPDTLLSGWALGAGTTRVGADTTDGRSGVVYTASVATNSFVATSISLLANTRYTVSVEARLVSGPSPATGQLISVEFDSNNNGTNAERANLNFAAVTLTSRWQRFTLTFDNIAAISGVQAYFLSALANGAQVALDNVQIEAGGAASSVVATSGVAATREADGALLASGFAGVFGPDLREGTLVYEADVSTAAQMPSGAESNSVFFWSSTSAAKLVLCTRVNASGPPSLDAYATNAAGIAIVDGADAPAPVDGVVRHGLTWASDRWVVALNGAVVSALGSWSVPIGFDRFQINGGGPTSMALRRLQFFPRAVSSTELAALTRY